MIFSTALEKFFFYKIPTYLFIFIPISLISGPFFSDLSVSLIVILYLIYCFKKNNFKAFKNIFFYIFFSFYLYLVINSVFINFNLTSIKISIFYFRFGVFVIAILELIKVNRSFLKYFFYSLISCFSFLIIDGYFQYFYGENFFGMELSQKKRVSSLFGDELIMGSYVSRLFPIYLGLSIFYFSKNLYQNFVTFFLILLLYGLVFISGERTSFFFITLSIIIIFFLTDNLIKYKSIFLIGFVALLTLVTFFNDSAKKRLIDQTINQMNFLDSNEVLIFSIQHTHHYITAYRVFLDNKTFGVGVKQFNQVCDFEKYKISKWSCSTHPHNSYIQLLSETGLIGFLFLFTLFSYIIYTFIKHIVHKIHRINYLSNYQICIITAILLSIWPLAPSGNFFNNWLSIIYFLPITLLQDIKNRKY